MPTAAEIQHINPTNENLPLPQLFTGSGASLNDGSKEKILRVLLHFKTNQVKELEECLSYFMNLKEVEKESAWGPLSEKIFTLVFGEDAFIQGSPGFEEYRKSPWSSNCHLSPRIFITPSTSHQISQILTICRFLNIKFSIRGGGHFQIPGFNSNNGGIVIMMSKFNQVILSEDKSTCDVGLGLRWLEVYEALDPYGLAVLGARVPHVGVSGFLLGGGLSFQNGVYGFSCNSVVDYEVVLADSSIVHANAKENPDLFWALKGGCNNFGILTKVQMTTIPNGIWSRAAFYSCSEIPKLIEALIPFHSACEKDPKGSLIWNNLGNNAGAFLIFVYCDSTKNHNVFKAFDDIPVMKDVIPGGYRTVCDTVQRFGEMLLKHDEVVLIHQLRTISTLPDLELYYLANKLLLTQTPSSSTNIKNLKISLVIQPISSSTIHASNLRGGNPLGLKPQQHQWLLYVADFSNPADETKVHDLLSDMIAQLEQVARRNGTWLAFRYANHAGEGQDPLGGYGEGCLRRLEEVGGRVDPEGFFQWGQGGGWLFGRRGVGGEGEGDL